MAEYIVISVNKLKHRNIIIKYMEKYFKNSGLIFVHALKTSKASEAMVFKMPRSAEFKNNIKKYTNKGICRYSIVDRSKDAEIISDLLPIIARAGEIAKDVFETFPPPFPI